LSGESFYVDDMGEQLPVTADQIARVPVFTSFPTITKPLQVKDSLLLMQIKETGAYMLKNNFWMAQIDQININNYEMEMIPKLGKHSILFGDGTKVEQKFNRLLLFYKQIMSKTGWNYYSTLDVRFDKQLVAVRRDSVSLFKSFVIPKDNIQISPIIDSINLARDSSLTILPVKKDSNKVLTSKTITPNLPSKALAKEGPKSDPVKKPVAAKVNAVKPQTPVKQKSLTDEEKILLEAKKKTEKPKAEMKKKDEN
jgi:cell division protein FtsQ